MHGLARPAMHGVRASDDAAVRVAAACLPPPHQVTFGGSDSAHLWTRLVAPLHQGKRVAANSR